MAPRHPAVLDPDAPPEAPLDCVRCDRLAAYRAENRSAEPEWFNAPVPSFGDENAWLLIVGLAPGVTGANRTGRPFTGDYAGDLLYGTLLTFGLAAGTYGARADDGLKLQGAMITNAVRCVPPQNKPTGPEIRTCRDYLAARIRALPRLDAMIALGRIAHDSVVALTGTKAAAAPFAHNARHDLTLPDGRAVRLHDSYHCSRYNTNTGRLTTQMFHAVFAAAVAARA